MGISCKMCGTENGDGLKFCSACGNALEPVRAAISAPSLAGGSANKSKTMIMSPAAKVRTEPQPVPAAAAASLVKEAEISKRTVMGIPAITADHTGAAKQVPAAKVSGTPFAAPSNSVVSTASAVAAEPRKKASPSPSRTVLGMAAVTAPSPVAVPSAQPILKPVSEKAPAAKPAPHGGGSRTMLGMPAMGFDAPAAAEKIAPLPAVAAEPSRPTKQAPATDVLPTITETEVEKTRKKSNRPDSSAAVQPPTVSRDSDYDNESEEGQKSKGLIIAVAIAGTVAIVAVFVIVYLTIFDQSNAIRPQIVPSADGKSVTVGLPFPEAEPGTVIQAVGQSVPIEQGQARITIPMAQIKLGTNNIPLSYIEPGESPEQMTFPIVLRHSVTDDFSGLVTEKPFITIAFQIAPGVRLTVDGQPSQVVNNAYFHKISIADAKSAEGDGDFKIIKLPFQLIDETGAVEQGEHVTAVPLTKLQIDRPAPAASVTAESVMCSGASEEGAQITVNGNPVGVTAKSFSTTVPLADMGEHKIAVVARSPGKAPRKLEVTVNRIESLAPVIAEWSVDLDTKLDYPTIGRDPNASVGKKVKLNGRVVNISTEKGVTAFIQYVGDGCPARSKCAVYVVFRGETDAGLQSWVDVYGTVRGTRAVEMQNGVKIEVPAVDAAYVVQTENRTKIRSKN